MTNIWRVCVPQLNAILLLAPFAGVSNGFVTHFCHSRFYYKSDLEIIAIVGPYALLVYIVYALRVEWNQASLWGGQHHDALLLPIGKAFAIFHISFAYRMRESAHNHEKCRRVHCVRLWYLGWQTQRHANLQLRKCICKTE